MINNTFSESIKPKKILRRLFKYLSKYRFLIILALIFLTISAAVTAGNIYLMKLVMDAVTSKSDFSKLKFLSLLAALLLTAKALSEYFQNYLIKLIGFKTVNDIQKEFYVLFTKLDVDISKHGDILSRFSNDIQIIRNGLSIPFLSLTKNLLSLLFVTFVMIKINLKFTLFSLIFFSLITIPNRFIALKTKILATELQKNNSKYLSNLKDLLREGLKDPESGSKYSEKALEIYKKIIKLDSFVPAISEIFNGSITLLMIYYVSKEIQTNSISFGDLVSFLGALNSFGRPLKSLLCFNFTIQECISAASRVFDVLDEKIYDSKYQKNSEYI